MVGFVGGGAALAAGRSDKAAVCRRDRGRRFAVTGGDAPNLIELTQRLGDLLRNEVNSELEAAHGAHLAEASAVKVAVVLGKTLIRDQLTVEYAKRIFTLIKRLSSPDSRPSVVVFVGGKEGGLVSEAAAGYLFFRSLCDQCDLDLTDLKFVLIESSVDRPNALRDIFARVNKELKSDVMPTCHFTFISSDYHLFRIQEVQKLTPSRSLLRPLALAQSTWDFVYAFYPFCVSREPMTAFLGRVTVLTSDLSIVASNLEAVVEERFFLAKENWDRLNTTVAKLRKYYEVLHHPKAIFQVDMSAYSETLERCILQLRKVQQILAPLRDPQSKSQDDISLDRARNLMAMSIEDIRANLDPDRPISSGDLATLRREVVAHFAAADKPATKLIEVVPDDQGDQKRKQRTPPRQRPSRKAVKAKSSDTTNPV